MYKVNVETLTKYRIPQYMHGGIIRYYENGISPGGFLCAVINNDLSGAVIRADHTNILLLPSYASWFDNEAPPGTHGYPGAVDDYLKAFRAKEQANV